MKYKAAQDAGNYKYLSSLIFCVFKSLLWLIDARCSLFVPHLGYFDQEIVSVSVPGRKGTTTLISKDENPRPETTKEGLGKLRPAFVKVDMIFMI